MTKATRYPVDTELAPIYGTPRDVRLAHLRLHARVLRLLEDNDGLMLPEGETLLRRAAFAAYVDSLGDVPTVPVRVWLVAR